MYLLAFCISSLKKKSIQVLCPFFNCYYILLLSCTNSLYILDINPLSDTRFANIFFQSVGCLFILMISFVCRSFLVWRCPACLILLLLSLLLESDAKTTSPRPMSRSLLPMVSSWTFMVSGLMFKALIHFELIFLMV